MLQRKHHPSKNMKIICGTDFSEAARDAADVAAAMAAELRIPLHLIHCVSDWLVPAELPLDEFVEPCARRSLDAESLRLSRTGLKIITELRHGSAAHHLLAATEPGAVCLVVGSTGKGTVQRFLLGSVSEHVAQKSGVPVLVVKEKQPLLDWLIEEAPIRTLCAAEWTESGDDAVQAMGLITKLGGLSFEVAHIITSEKLLIQAAGFLNPPATDGADAPESVVSLQRDIADQCKQTLGVIPAAVHIRESLGNPAYEFLSLAHERETDLIVLGSHHRHGISRLSHPSFSRRILGHATTNVLCVPARVPATAAPPSPAYATAQIP
jgi:nucleotide-binding universal stress UspA family protein